MWSVEKRVSMALQLRRSTSMRVRLITTLIAAFAFIVQPYVGVIANQNVNALAVSDHVVINEISPSPLSGSEWIELYNPTVSNVVVDGWTIKDASNPAQPISGTIMAGGFKTFNVVNFNNSGDTAVLSNTTSVVDTVIYSSAIPGDNSYARTYDANDAFEIRSAALVTKNTTNGAAPVVAPVCTYDFTAEKMWEVTWGYGFEDRNGGTPVFDMQSNGGLVSLNGGAVPGYMTPTWHWLYVTDNGNYTPRHYTYGFADGTIRTADVTFSNVNGCQIPTIVWGMQEPLPATAVINQNTGETFDGLEEAINDPETQAGHTLRINENLTLSNDVDVTKDVTIDGQGKTIFANFIKTNNSNNAALSILTSGVTVQNLIVDGAAGTNLHGINVFEATDVLLSSVTSKNFRTGIVASQGSDVVVHDVTTSGNTWHGMNADKPNAKLTVIGTSNHYEGTGIPHIFVDNNAVGTVIDFESQYIKTTISNGAALADVYMLPDPTNSHTLNISGDVYRDIALDNCDNLDECKNQRTSEMLAGWEMHLYKESQLGEWVQVKTATTNQDGTFNFGTQQQAGVYHVCEVVKAGWTQPIQTWTGSGYLVATSNASDVVGEGPYCTTINYTDEADKSNKSHFGNVDTGKPVGVAAYSGGVMVDDVIYIKSINDLSFTEKIDDNHGVVRGTYLVQKLNPATNVFEGFCGNWNAGGSGSHLLGGSVHEEYTETNIQGCVADQSKWVNGTYKIFHAAYDAAGNEGKFNTQRQEFVIDNTAPVSPAHISPLDNAFQNFNDFYFDWNNVADAVEYEFQSSQSATTGSDGGLTTGIWNNKQHAGSDRNHLTDSKIHSYGANGTWYWQVRAIDIAGNKSAWTYPWKMTIDTVVPAAPTLTSPSNGVPINGVNPVANNWEDVADAHHYIYQSYNVKSDGACNFSSIRWTQNYTASQTDSRTLADGLKYCWRVKTVDAASNESPWSATWVTVVDNTAPTQVTGVSVYDQQGEVTNGATSDYAVTTKWNAISDAVKYEYCYWNDIATSVYRESNCYGVIQTNTEIAGVFNQGEGMHHIKVRAIDAAGNVGPWSETFDVLYDNTDPNPTLNTVATNNTTSRIITGTGQAGEAVEVTVHSTPQTKTTTVGNDGIWSVTFDNLEIGLHTVHATITDIAGNFKTLTGNFEVLATAVTPSEPEDTTVKNTDSNNTPVSATASPIDTLNQAAGLAGAGAAVLGVSSNISSSQLNENQVATVEDGEVKSATTTTGDAEKKPETTGCGIFLGICWYWWIPIVIAAIIAVYYLFRPRREEV
jgi:hypothetical protein